MKVATQWMQVFCQQPQKRDHLKNIEVLAPDTLNSISQHFLTKRESYYEAIPLVVMQSSIVRYLREPKYKYSVLNSRLLKGSIDVLEGKAHLLREKGLGKKPNKTNSLTRQHEDIL